MGCGNSGPPPVVPDLPDASAASKAMELYDTNHDGFLDAKELEKAPGLKAAIKQVDTNHDGKISEQEIADRIKSWADSQIGRMPVALPRDAQRQAAGGREGGLRAGEVPGRHASVRLGNHRRNGLAISPAPMPADPTVQGLSPGFYRVEITKDGENIPAKYNTETTLGAEVASGSETGETV